MPWRARGLLSAICADPPPARACGRSCADVRPTLRPPLGRCWRAPMSIPVSWLLRDVHEREHRLGNVLFHSAQADSEVLRDVRAAIAFHAGHEKDFTGAWSPVIEHGTH